jgi:succinoglycan biosynthesis transport protein ExoP
LLDYQSHNNVVFLQEQGSSADSYLSKINRQLAALRTEYELIQLLDPQQLNEVSPNSRALAADESNPGEASANQLANTLAQPQAEYFKTAQQIALLKSKRDDLSKFLRPTHPKIVKLDEEITGQEKLVAVFKQQSLKQLENRRQALKHQIQVLEKSFEQWDAKALEASRKMADYERIRQDVQRTQGLYDRLLGVIQTVDVNKNLAQQGVTVLEAAGKAKSVSNAMKLIALGVLASLVITFSLFYLIELFDDRFASLAELRNHLPELVVGQVPELPGRKPGERIELLQPHDDRHVFVESIRNIRSSLLFTVNPEARLKTLLVTSSVPEEGKSTVVANLAVAMALAGSRVLLVDADLRRPVIHKFFKLPLGPGMAEALEQKTQFASVVQSTDLPNLSIVTAGECTDSPGELFLMPSVDVFLRDVQPLYDYVLIDSAPVLATDDTTSFGPKIDGVLFVVRGSFTSARMARTALEMLHQRKIKVLGLIFNRAISTISESYYYQYKKYYKPVRPANRAS